ARQDDMARGVEHGVDALRRLAWLNERRDPRPLDDNPAFGAFGENRQRVLDPRPHTAPPPIVKGFLWRGSAGRVSGQPRTRVIGNQGDPEQTDSPILILFPIMGIP